MICPTGPEPLLSVFYVRWNRKLTGCALYRQGSTIIIEILGLANKYISMLHLFEELFNTKYLEDKITRYLLENISVDELYDNCAVERVP